MGTPQRGQPWLIAYSKTTQLSVFISAKALRDLNPENPQLNSTGECFADKCQLLDTVSGQTSSSWAERPVGQSTEHHVQGSGLC